MEKLIFASNNSHKADEIRRVLGGRFQIQTLSESGINIDIPEPYDTLEENARTKSRTIHSLTGQDCFSEDSGLEVDALQGAPGVRSARYAGDNQPSSVHIAKLLNALDGMENRKARFRTVISLMLNGEEYQFTGTCEGSILESPTGQEGFGYDPVFAPLGQDRSFAEMTTEEKNIFSHRSKALHKLIDFLDKRHF